MIHVDPKELKIILGYDVNALKANIDRHQKNITVWTRAIEEAKQAINELEGYIRLIEENKIGH